MATPKAKINMVKTEEQPTMVTVELIGSHTELQGEHTLFHGKSYIAFFDGKATIPSTMAEQLRKLGTVK